MLYDANFIILKDTARDIFTCSPVSDVQEGGNNDIQQTRSSYGCLFSIDLRDPGRVVDGAPSGPSLVLARLTVSRGATAVL